uniref:Uncharacterized protein n=1 Tax=Octopus bimaculoides TaxID=37653 RepID=A0A0L8FVF3_OCTBM
MEVGLLLYQTLRKSCIILLQIVSVEFVLASRMIHKFVKCSIFLWNAWNGETQENMG